MTKIKRDDDGGRYIELKNDRFESKMRAYVYEDEPNRVSVYAVYEEFVLIPIFEFNYADPRDLDKALDAFFVELSDAALPLHMAATGSEV